MLDFLFQINWKDLETAYGRAIEVPDQIMRLNSPIDTIRAMAQWELYGNVYHQGTIYEAATSVIPFLVELQNDGEYTNKCWIQNYIDDLCYYESQEEEPSESGDNSEFERNRKPIEINVKVYNTCLISYNHGYSQDDFDKIKQIISSNSQNGFKTYDIPDLKKYKIGYMGPSREEAEAKVAEFRAQGHWDIILEDRMYKDQIVVFIPKAGPTIKPASQDIPSLQGNETIPNLITTAMKFFEQKNYSGSASLFKRLIDQGNGDPMAYHFLMESFFSLNKPMEAIEYGEKMIAIYGEIPGAQVDYGRLQILLKRNWMGIQALEKAIATLPQGDPLLQSWIALASFQIADFQKCFVNCQAAIQGGIEDPRLDAYYPIVALLENQKSDALEYLHGKISSLFQTDPPRYFDFLNSINEIRARMGLHFQNAGLWKISPDSLFIELQEYIIHNLENASDRTEMLEIIYFLNQMIYNKKQISLPEFQNTEGLVLLMEKLMEKNINYWYEVNRLGWIDLLPKKPFEKRDNQYESKLFGECLRRTGERYNNPKIRCFGMDIIAANLAKSESKDDLVLGKAILDEIKKISTEFYTPSTYETIMKKLQK